MEQREYLAPLITFVRDLKDKRTSSVKLPWSVRRIIKMCTGYNVLGEQSSEEHFGTQMSNSVCEVLEHLIQALITPEKDHSIPEIVSNRYFLEHGVSRLDIHHAFTELEEYHRNKSSQSNQEDILAPLVKIKNELKFKKEAFSTILPTSFWSAVEKVLGKKLLWYWNTIQEDRESVQKILDYICIALTIMREESNDPYGDSYVKSIVRALFEDKLDLSDLELIYSDLKRRHEGFPPKTEEVAKASKTSQASKISEVTVFSQQMENRTVHIKYNKTTSTYTFSRSEPGSSGSLVVTFQDKEGLTLEEILERIREQSANQARKKVVQALFMEEF